MNMFTLLSTSTLMLISMSMVFTSAYAAHTDDRYTVDPHCSDFTNFSTGTDPNWILSNGQPAISRTPNSGWVQPNTHTIDAQWTSSPNVSPYSLSNTITVPSEGGDLYLTFAADNTITVNVNGTSYPHHNNIVFNPTPGFGNHALAYQSFDIPSDYPISLTQGSYSINATITDAGGDAGAIIIAEFCPNPLNHAPICSDATIDIDSLWPPNHKFQTVTPNMTAFDVDGDELSFSILTVFQDESVDDIGDGNTSPDAIINDDGTVDVRAERTGTENGRVYTITVQADDGNGGMCTGSVILGVPHDKKDVAIDGGAYFDSTQ